MNIASIIKSNFFSIRAFLNNKRGQFSQAIKNSDNALRINPRNAGAYWYKGTALYRLGKYSEGLESYNLALDLVPLSKFSSKRIMPHLLYNIGACYMKLNQMDAGINCFDKAIAIDSFHYKAYAGKACAYSLQDNPKKAMENLIKAVNINPHYRRQARNEADFNKIRTMKEFQEVVGS